MLLPQTPETSSIVGYPEWCEHSPHIVVHDDGTQELRCAVCNYVFHAWSEPLRIEHFDHA